jgi:hypothetical protein
MRLTIELDWLDPSQVLRVLLGEEVRDFMCACAAADKFLIQIEPFVPFPRGHGGHGPPRHGALRGARQGPLGHGAVSGPLVAVTLVGVKVPHENYTRSGVPTRWKDVKCIERRLVGVEAPAFKAWCDGFPNPKIFVEVVSCGRMYGFGAYIEWLRAKQAREARETNDAKKANGSSDAKKAGEANDAKKAYGASGSLKHLTAFMLLMRKVFGEDTLVRVHNTDVPFFHIKKVR